MQIDFTFGQPPSDMAHDAAIVEDVGFDACWVGETNPDPFLKCLQAAEATRGIPVGSAAIAIARTPMTLAYSGYDLARASQGRFVLGFGSQVKAHVERRFSMPWTSPAARMREMLLALRAIWASWQDGTKLDFNGEFYHHTLMTLSTFAVIGSPESVASQLHDRWGSLAGRSVCTPYHMQSETCNGGFAAFRDESALTVK